MVTKEEVDKAKAIAADWATYAGAVTATDWIVERTEAAWDKYKKLKKEFENESNQETSW